MIPFQQCTSEALLSVIVGLSCLVSVVVARSTQSPDNVANASRKVLNWSLPLATSAMVAAARLLGAGDKYEPKTKVANDDKSMTYRQDRGITKLVPLLPESRSYSKKKKTPLKKYTMAQVAEKCNPDEIWIIIDGRVYDITKYIDKHPGGQIVLLRMGGKDCTDVFANYHQARIYNSMLPPFLIGEVTDMPVYQHVEDFRAVRQELLRRGLFETSKVFYRNIFLWLASLFLSSLYFSLACTSTTSHMIGALFMGAFWQQFAGVGHDLGHSSISHNFYTDHYIGSLFGCMFMGISTGWWKRSHNTHHVVCNSIDGDPDIQHFPIMAVNPKCIEKPFWSTYHNRLMVMDKLTKFFVSNQHLIFFPLMMVARFNLYAQSWILVCNHKQVKMYNRALEACSLSIFMTWLLSVALCMNTWTESVAWVLVSHAVGGLLHIQIVISHWAMETYHGSAYNGPDDEWYKMQLKTTMNVDCYEWMDFFHIGLQFQIEHHLFPMLPRHNLREARKLVKAVCHKHDIHYHEPCFFTALQETVKTLCVTAAKARAGEAVPNLLIDGLNAEG